MRDEPDYESDASFTECAICGDEIGAGYILNGHAVCYRCRHDSPEAQAMLEADRQADIAEEDERHAL